MQNNPCWLVQSNTLIYTKIQSFQTHLWEGNTLREIIRNSSPYGFFHVFCGPSVKWTIRGKHREWEISIVGRQKQWNLNELMMKGRETKRLQSELWVSWGKWKENIVSECPEEKKGPRTVGQLSKNEETNNGENSNKLMQFAARRIGNRVCRQERNTLCLLCFYWVGPCPVFSWDTGHFLLSSWFTAVFWV